MRFFEEKIIQEPQLICVKLQCDVCKKEFTADDFIEVQEFHHINFVGGYGSVFGDESHIQCDICQRCLFEMIKDFYREEV